MREKFSPELEQHLAFHRGIGAENTLIALQSGIEQEPYLQEFDVQRYSAVQHFIGSITRKSTPSFNYKEELALGHPPEINLDESLQDALQLFKESSVLPKIDLKPQWWQVDHLKTMDILLETLDRFNKPALINISGSPRKLPFLGAQPSNFIQLERYLSEYASDQTFINLDLGRFGSMPDNQVSAHIKNLQSALPSRVHSFSPLIDNQEGIDRSIQLAMQHNISDIHFWGIQSHAYPEERLISLANQVLMAGLHPVIDVATHSIVPLTN